MRRLLLSTPVALGLLLAGCGGDSGGASRGTDESSPVQAVHAAAERTAEQHSARMDLTMETSTGSTRNTIRGSGVFELAGTNPSGAMTMELGSLAPGKQVEVRLLPGVVYLKAAGLFPLPAGKAWLAIDLDEVARQSGANLQALQQLSGNSAQSLSYLQAASDDVREVGTESVRGARTTHYRGTLDFDKAAASQPELRELLAQAKQKLGTARLPFDAWIAEDGTLRRMRQSVSVQGAEQVVTLEIYDYGTDVDVAAPPAAEVQKFQLPAGTQQSS